MYVLVVKFHFIVVFHATTSSDIKEEGSVMENANTEASEKRKENRD